MYVVRRVFTRPAARLLPFPIWASILPMKRRRQYSCDDDGKIIVDYLGATHKLNEDLFKILASAGIATRDLAVPHINQSKPGKVEEYLGRDSYFYRRLSKKYETDINLIELVKDNFVDCRSEID